MTQTRAMFAIFAVMVASCGFGYFMHGLLTEAKQSHTEPPGEPDSRSCETCRYEKVKPSEDPCFECSVGDIDRWEAKV